MKNEPPIRRRILVGLDASSDSLAALRTAARMATAGGAELHGVFVEDENLLRVASCPGARLVGTVSASRRGVGSVHMERALRAVAARARRALVEVAAEARLPWGFRVARGGVASELVKAADEADMVVLGRASRAAGRIFVGSTAHAVVAEARRPVLLLKRPLRLGGTVMALVPDVQAVGVCIAPAVAVARALEGPLVLLAGGLDPGVGSVRQAATLELARVGWGAPVQYRSEPGDDPRRLARAMQRDAPEVLVVDVRPRLGQTNSMQDLARLVPTSLLLVR